MEASSPIERGLGVVQMSGFSLYYLGVGPPGEGPLPTPAPTPPPEECPALQATGRARTGAIALGALLGLLNIALLAVLLWLCCKPAPAEEPEPEEEPEQEIEEYLGLPDVDTANDINDLKVRAAMQSWPAQSHSNTSSGQGGSHPLVPALLLGASDVLAPELRLLLLCAGTQNLPAPPSEARPLALQGPYSGGAAVTDAHLYHNPEHFEPRAEVEAADGGAEAPKSLKEVGKAASRAGSEAAVPPVAEEE